MRNVYSVGQLNSYIKNMFTQDYLLQSVYVKGEVSNCKYHTSGHIYFTLKDPRGTVSCVMFAGNRKGLSFRMQDGQQVIAGGTVDVYERDGKYQLYAKEIQLDGAGQLYEKYEQLKRELEEQGMFAEQFKQPIPRYIRTLGVVTARTGAAVRDIIQIASRRNPRVQIIVYPAIVQGEEAVPSIVNGIHALEQIGVDVMIVGRGGGSIEDLWAFNERAVAQAVFDCSVPVISAVGHETDTTIIDYVADLRAPTPSAAAELAVWDIRETYERLAGYKEMLLQNMNRKIRMTRERAKKYESQLRILSPAGKIRSNRQYQAQLAERLEGRMQQILYRKRHELELYIEKMKGLSPLERLSGGYSYVEDGSGKNIRSVRQLHEGEIIRIRMRDGSAEAKILGTSEPEQAGF
ncbi:MAG: exodeoxyribonuclease VII large subunit [Lachnospiraceae bacterium]|nr:exodeoxyribonuclease VII large subunit [Lachnospiraceae bacterium]